LQRECGPPVDLGDQEGLSAHVCVAGGLLELGGGQYHSLEEGETEVVNYDSDAGVVDGLQTLHSSIAEEAVPLLEHHNLIVLLDCMVE